MRGTGSEARPSSIARERLEGLILHDGAGAFYEVPWPVIERYRVSDERAAELDGPAPAGVRGLGGQPWTVEGGVYAAARVSGRPPFGNAQLEGEQ